MGRVGHSGANGWSMRVKLPTPWLAFLGDVTDPLDAKTAFGVRDWAADRLVGEWSLNGEVTLGCP